MFANPSKSPFLKPTTHHRFTTSDAWREHEEAEAKKRMEAGRPKKGVETLPQDNGKTRDKIGERVGVSGPNPVITGIKSGRDWKCLHSYEKSGRVCNGDFWSKASKTPEKTAILG